MGLETSQYIAGLTVAWPPAGDPKSQGDDHIRLIKGVLQATFPNATKPFSFPVTAAISAGLTLTVADQNKTLFVTTTGGDVVVTLPTLTGADGGWWCEVIKGSADANGVMVTPPSGTISSVSGGTGTIRVGMVASIAKFMWSGIAWFCFKSGPLVGETLNWDSSVVPFGCFVLDGSAFNGTTYAELASVLGGTTLRDKRGRVEAGVDTATNRLVNAMPGANGLGGVGGLDYHVLTTAQIPSHGHTGTTDGDSPDHTHSYTAAFASTQVGLQGGGTYFAYISSQTQASTTGGASARHTHTYTSNPTGGSNLHPNVQPTIVTQKIIRAC